VGDLFTAFDNGRLAGVTAPLPASYATIPAASVVSLPHYGGQGCRILQITPTDVTTGGVIDPAPQDFNPRPSTNPGTPYQGGWPSN
jgi:phospholipase C